MNKLKSYLQLPLVLRWCYLIPISLLISLNAYTQTDFCDFEECMDVLLEEYPDLEEQLLINEDIMFDMMEENPQAIMNGVVYTIPVVFHVIHLGETIGTGSNISDGLINQALADLNSDFRDVPGTGYDSEIEFCLAQRDPDGNFTTGINRVNGSGVGNYENIGIAAGFNEVDVKGLSIWSNEDYLNIWIVHNIQGGQGTVLGYATFPGTDASVDGIVMRASATGASAFSKVIAHEGGHFFNLYHTFQGGNPSTCPDNDNCQVDGDRVCDTPPHLLVFGGCNSSGTNTCDNGSSLELVVHNHMNYTDNSCRDEFTPDQVMRMRCALMELRPTLMNSIGCQPACTTVTAAFTGPDSGNQGVTLNFTNTSTTTETEPLDYTWLVEGQELNFTDLTYEFTNPGQIAVCLRASNSNCTNQICKIIEIIPAAACFDTIPGECQYLINGDLVQNTLPFGQSRHYTPSNDQTANANLVCNWNVRHRTPYFCSSFLENSFGLYNLNREAIVNQFPLDLVDGDTYTLAFEYYVNRDRNSSHDVGPKLRVGLSGGAGIAYNSPNDEILAFFEDLPFDDLEGQNVQCHEQGASFQYFEMAFTYFDGMGEYLFFEGERGNGVVGMDYTFIRNIRIERCFECNPIPDFEFQVQECGVEFSGTNTGDEGTYYWNFGDGSSATGPDVSHTFIFGGTFDVCLTITCLNDIETSSTICKEVTIPEACTDCIPLDTIPAVICEMEDGDSIFTFISNFEIEIPSGYEPCIDDLLYVMSPDVSITITSWNIDSLDATTDLLTIAIEITPPVGYDLSELGATVYMTLCSPQGEFVCYIFEIEGSTCDRCQEVTTIPECNDSLSTNDVFVYEGSIDLTFDNPVVECDHLSPDMGFVIGNVTQNGLDWTLDYTLTTTQEGAFESYVLLCFEDEENEMRVCIDVTIDVPESCRVLPEECVRRWNQKTMPCEDVTTEGVIINIPDMSLNANGYSLCNGELFGTIDGGGTVVVNEGEIVNNSLNFNLTIIMPLDYDPSLVYDLRLFMCNDEGEVFCYLFPYKFPCNIITNDDDDDGEVGTGGGGNDNNNDDNDDGRGRSSIHDINSKNRYNILPNPAKDYLLINSEFLNNQEAKVRVEIYDQSGRVLSMIHIKESRVRIDLSDYFSGVYLIRIFEDEIPVVIEKIVIIK